jgi:hypothetical protein
MNGGRYPSKIGVTDGGGLQSHPVIESCPGPVQSVYFAAPSAGECHVISKNEGANMMS